MKVRSLLSVFFLLYLAALHLTMAGMEIFAWLIFVTVVGAKIVARERFEFPLWPALTGLTVIVGVSLFANPELKSFWYQFGFMRWIFLLWAYYWGFQIVWSPQFESRLKKVWLGLFFLTAGYASFQCLTGLDPVHSHQVIYPESANLFKATGFFGFSLTYAYSIGISFFVIAAVLWREAQPRTLVFLAFAGAMGLLASMSKGAWLAAGVAVLTYVIFERRKLLPYVLGGGGLSVGILMMVSDVFRRRMGTLLFLEMDHSAGVRVKIWRAYFEMFKDHPWLGIGIFQGDKLLPEYYAKLGIVEEFVSHAHNMPLQWAAGAGIFALVLYVGLSFVFLRMAWRLRKVSGWGWGLFLAQLFWHIGSLTEANFIDGEVNHFIVFTWALLQFLNSRRPVAS